MQIPIECPRCGCRIDPVDSAEGTQIICPQCSLDVTSDTGRQSINRKVEEEHPELASSTHQIMQVRWISLAVSLFFMVSCILLVMQNHDRSFLTQVIPLFGIIAVVAGFVWAYTGFALNLKSRTRGH